MGYCTYFVIGAICMSCRRCLILFNAKMSRLLANLCIKKCRSVQTLLTSRIRPGIHIRNKHICQSISALAARNTSVCHIGPVYHQRVCQFTNTQPLNNEQTPILTGSEFEDLCQETLDSLGDKFEELIEGNYTETEYDVSLSIIRVIISGPKRYDYIGGCWIYKHDGRTLHQLLSEEMSKAFNTSIDFTPCANSGAT
ncbi:hypothetical protein LSH36_147g08030 [Paralvinella palmiformis]|uniref:Uncharacterized protein n=1 Tax=Paralvinella palmiformis TaxID=53620 RepID=A0AAD9JV65_9ANNE|nr:hypothetical protein LSH36_147g08030 [Paralvinella palmiformis]